jgi:uncharacterized repeat protein (TIGR03803 family)
MNIQNKSLLPGLLVLAGALLPLTASAEQTLETLVSFNGQNGSNPESIVQGPNGNFYGTTYNGGTGGKGTLFVVPLNSPIRTLVSFNGANGANPEARLVEWSDGNLYGSTYSGGAYNKGTIFQLTPSGAFHTVVSFSGPNGAFPVSGLLIGSDGGLYGTTSNGGGADRGTLFKITRDGRMTTIVSFNGPNGANPQGLLLGMDGNFYGTTAGGGLNNNGTIFELTPQGRMITLVRFNGIDGANPHARLGQLSNGVFYGTTYNGGQYNLGTVFTYVPPKNALASAVSGPYKSLDYATVDPKDMNPTYGSTPGNGDPADPADPGDPGLTTLVSFNGENGAHPDSPLVPWSNGYFYFESLYDNTHFKSSDVQWSGVNFVGTTTGGGAHGNGSVFQVTDAGALTTLVSFSGINGEELGTIPTSIVPGDDGNIYGTTYYGGPSNGGTIFRLSLKPFPAPGVPPNSVSLNIPANSP